MSCKSLLYTALTSATPVAAGGTIPPGNVVRKMGRAIQLNGNAILLNEAGFYKITVISTVQPDAAAPITMTLKENGSPIPGALATATPTAIDDDTLLVVDGVVRVYCSLAPKLITAELNVGADVENMTITIEKV